MKKISFLLLVSLMAGACSTMRINDPQKDIEDILWAFNEKQADFLISRSVLPFLIDGEIILKQNDLVFYWENIIKIGPLEAYTIGPLTKLSTEDFYLYDDTLEVSLFFEKYLPKRAYLAMIESPKGTFRFIIGYDENSKPSLWGIRGPENE